MFLRLVGVILTFIGIAGFLMPLWINAVVTETHKLEFPLTEISDVAVSENGDLYFSLLFAGRECLQEDVFQIRRCMQELTESPRMRRR